MSCISPCDLFCSVLGSILLNGIDMRALGYECANYVARERATHVFLRTRT